MNFPKTIALATICLLGADARFAKSAERPPTPLRAQVDSLLRREATAKTTDERRTAVRDLVDLARQIDASTGIAPAERSRARNRVRARLAQLRRELEQPAAADRAARRDRPPLLAQVGPGAGGGPGNPPAPPDHGDDLAELIRQTVAPETWDVNGGNGVIVYFPARRVLVVRQQSEVHWGLADVLNQLHGN